VILVLPDIPTNILYSTPIVGFEAQKTKAWVGLDVRPEVVIKEAQERLDQQEWNALRPALSVTVRAWIMQGFVEGGVCGAHAGALQYLGYALEVLEWGSRTWKDALDEERGAIFKSTLIRGVRSLHISAFM
jgi:hypothetical protein